MSRTIEKFEKVKGVRKSTNKAGFYYHVWWYGDLKPTVMSKTNFEEINPNLIGKDITPS